MMDRNFHNDEFERLLREKSNEFRMYPSKRIWHSIYNNIHPGRKWPSIAMSITLITSLFLVGYLNTRNTSLLIEQNNTEASQKIIAQSILSPQHPQTPAVLLNNTGNQVVYLDIFNKPGTVPINSLKSVETNDEAGDRFSLKTEKNLPHHLSNDNVLTADNTLSGTNKTAKDKEIIHRQSQHTTRVNSYAGLTVGVTEIVANLQPKDIEEEQGFLTVANKTPFIPLIQNESNIDLTVQVINERLALMIQPENATIDANTLAINKNDVISSEDKSWIENYALYNRPATKKWANKLDFQIYATPSVVYRVLSNQPDFGNNITAAPFAISTSTQDFNDYLDQKPSFGLEVGTGIQYLIANGIKLKTGLQLNFTRYNADAFQNSHPVTTLLTMRDFNTNTSYQVSRATPYSNKSGLESVKLHNETFQISIPMGIDVRLLGNEKLQWNIGATIQPTYVAGGKSYLISTDRLNYVMEKSMLNRWNLNAGFETNVTFKSGDLTYQIGPQFRTQVYSTNDKKYAIEERLVNIGLKFGVSRTIK